MLKFLLLGLLKECPRYGYDLKSVFEEFLGGMWPLNIGQVYTTLSRLEQDGLVSSETVAQDLLPDRKVYQLTDEGRAVLAEWLDEPSEGPIRLRDEFFFKIVLRSRLRGASSLVDKQRRTHLRALAELARLRDDPGINRETALLLDGAALRAEAELKWLDLCEERLGGAKQ